MTIHLKNYSTEFKAEAVKRIKDNLGNLRMTARQLGLSKQILWEWQNESDQNKLLHKYKANEQFKVLMEENKRLKRHLQKLKNKK